MLPKGRRHERRIIDRREKPTQLDKRWQPHNTPMGAAQRIERILENYPEILKKARKEKASKEFIKELEEAYNKLRIGYLDKLVKYAERDGSTGLLNKSGFFNRVREYITNPNYVFSYVFIDLNYLKKINDTFGHEFGDEYLRTMGEATEEIGKSLEITIGRTGGDEFEVLLSIPRGPEYNYDRLVRDAIERLRVVAKDKWNKKRAEIGRQYGIGTENIPELSFAAGYSVGIKKCPVEAEYGAYHKLRPESQRAIDRHINELRKSAELEMYDNKKEMKAGR